MTLNPYCIDISSGAEDENGNKSLNKILKLKETLTNWQNLHLKEVLTNE